MGTLGLAATSRTARIRTMPEYEIAQLNVGRAVGPMDGEAMRDFADRLDEINALAEASPGFVWRLKGDNNNATDLKFTDDPRFIVNLTVWRSIDDLWAFTYASSHNQLFKRRFEWFERYGGAEHGHVVAARGHDPRHPRRARPAAAASPSTAPRPRRSRSSSGSRPRTPSRTRPRADAAGSSAKTVSRGWRRR